jgi:hypothetical protein
MSIENLSKAELLELVKKLEKKGNGRGSELLGLLRDNGSVSVESLCDSMGVNSRNLSSIKSGLKKSDSWGVDYVIVSYKISKESYWELISKGDDSFDRMVQFS